VEPVRSVLVPGLGGRAVAVDRRQRVRITDVEGTQVAALVAIDRTDPTRIVDPARTRSLTQRLFPIVGETFVSSRYEPMLTIVDDTSPGDHDTLFPACDSLMLEFLGAEPGHANCHDNIVSAAAAVGVELPGAPASVNLFQPNGLNPDETLSSRPAASSAGDHVEFRAARDLWVIVTACAVDVGIDVNGYRSTPIRVDVFDR
jgi:uncharacterized protein